MPYMYKEKYSETTNCHVGLSTGRVWSGTGFEVIQRVGSGRVGSSSMITRVGSGLEVYAGKPGRVTGNPHF
jgi:hypothetical protein